MTIEEELKRCATAAHWAKIGMGPHVGFSLPLSAAWSLQSCGIGEFFDLIPLLSWCKELGMDIIQLLPLNDSGYDPSPYNALSSLALHPIYLSLQALPYLDDDLRDKIVHMRDSLRENSLFSQVLARKEQFFSLYFQKTKEAFLKDEACMHFLNQTPWLDAYALFKGARSPDGLLLHKVLQYLCFIQLSTVKEHAKKVGVFLKGDIPILISPNSVDVWTNPELFDTTLGAGAPPDAYAPEGQSWGFPAFRWENMQREEYAWWKERLAQAEHFYDIYRVDHVVGLFRLWSIPHGKPSVEGHFIPSDERLWGPHGREVLEVFIHSSSMLPIAEDLGSIPPVTRSILQELGIPGTKVMRWERDWAKSQSFLDPKSYPPLSLTCVSTHDSPTLEQWWRDFPQEASIYATEKGWSYASKITQEQRETILRESIHSSSIFHINLLSEYLALLPEFVAKDPDKERINIPGTILPTNWAYRFQKPLEEIIVSIPLKEKIISLLQLG